MVRCPHCGNTYTDDTLRYCLSDGTTLVSDESRHSREPVTVAIGVPSRTTMSHSESSGPPRYFKIILGLLAGSVLIGSVVIVAAILYVNKQRVRETPASAAPSTPAIAPPIPAVPAADGETERLQKELSEVQKRIEEMAASAGSGISGVEAPNLPGGIRARVNSPNDRFLALRVLPDITTGDPLAKIPHGETITLGYCQQEFARVGSRSGHWCMTSYDGITGWVFDAWLDLPSAAKR